MSGARGRSEEIRIGGLAVRFLLEGDASQGSVAVFEFDVAAGAKVPAAHSHDAYEETIYGLAGVLTWTLNGQKTDIGPRELLCIPRGVIHRFDNPHGVDAKMLAIVSPGILGPNYFREIAAIVKASAGGPPDPAALSEVMRRHGLTPVP
jgi:quercetin dioxygenase-like cupin family protein